MSMATTRRPNIAWGVVFGPRGHNLVTNNPDLFETENCEKTEPMKRLIRRAAPLFLATAALVGLTLITPAKPVQANPSPFDTLLGSWRGSGRIMLNSGPERLRCNAYYTGGGSQLGMAILCKSDTSNVEIRSKLSLSGDRLTGNWEERTYNAQGSASGIARPGRLAIRVSGSVNGSMIVNYNRTSQNVSISTQGIALKSVSIHLTRS